MDDSSSKLLLYSKETEMFLYRKLYFTKILLLVINRCYLLGQQINSILFLFKELISLCIFFSFFVNIYWTLILNPFKNNVLDF